MPQLSQDSTKRHLQTLVSVNLKMVSRMQVRLEGFIYTAFRSYNLQLQPQKL